MGILIGVDIGGTFTDLIAFDEETGELYHAKSPSTPGNFVQGIMDCIRKGNVDLKNARNLVHGSTIAINTVIEENGARTALVTTKGMRDVYKIGRGNRPEAYNLFFRRPRPLVPRHLTYEVSGRMLPSGEELLPINLSEVEALCKELARQNVEAVAVCFIHSYANPAHERAVGEVLRKNLPQCYITLSSEVVREFREYERTSTTVVNAYVGPRVSRYIRHLQDRLTGEGFGGSISIMQSNGGVMSPETAMAKPVTMMESGPVGGIIASAEVGKALGYPNVIAFDMGGTTAKASLIRDGEPSTKEIYYINGYASGHPVMIPVVDVVEVGTGGGSIAWIDQVGALKVGPQSAGADPAPICYGKGGTEPTITDANVALGRIGTKDFLGGEMPLDRQAAEEGIRRRIAEPLGISMLRAAHAIVQIAITNMSLAVRQVSVEQGYDPRDFALLASGGAGPVHAVAIARELHIPTVIIPRFPSHFSALGMLLTDQKHDFVRTYISPMHELDFGKLVAIYREMEEEARALVEREYFRAEETVYQPYLDIRYVGQEFTLSVPVTLRQLENGDVQAIRETFDQLHDQRYGHQASNEPVEMINIRLTVTGKRAKPAFPKIAASGSTEPEWREVYFDDFEKPVKCPVYRRESLPAHFEIRGPAIIAEYGTSTLLFEGDVARVTETGEIVIRVGGMRHGTV
ncbi:MAG TPA: hydantoinase/oxoprolinase family protein [Paenibacillaceae bacterium]